MKNAVSPSEQAPAPDGETDRVAKPKAMAKPAARGVAPKGKAMRNREQIGRRRRRGPKPYPVITFEEAAVLGKGIVEHGAGHPMKRLTLLPKLKLSNSD